MILIDMDMPQDCNHCPLNDKITCNITRRSWNWGMETRPSWCPIVDIDTAGMRDATESERKSTTMYINSISKHASEFDFEEIYEEL